MDGLTHDIQLLTESFFALSDDLLLYVRGNVKMRFSTLKESR
jgi:hypothetical protein